MDVIIGLGFWKLYNPRYVIRLVSIFLPFDSWSLGGLDSWMFMNSSDTVLQKHYILMLMQLGRIRIWKSTIVWVLCLAISMDISLTMLLAEHIFVWCGKNVVNVCDIIFLFYVQVDFVMEILSKLVARQVFKLRFFPNHELSFLLYKWMVILSHNGRRYGGCQSCGWDS